MKLTLHVWRQKNTDDKGGFSTYELDDVSTHMSFLEMLDVLNQELEKAGRVADLFELAELMCRDARHRNESCGGHFREEYRTEEGEARRDDENFTNVTVWEYKGEDSDPEAHVEDLDFETVQPTQRSYK